MNMFKVLLKVLFLLFFIFVFCYCFVLYVDLRSYAALKNFELSNQKLINEKYKHYEWKSENVFLFMQLSDIHVSLFRDPSRVPDLRRFLRNELSLIQPEVVLVSGDLTDAKLPNYRASQQYEEEWKIYYNLLQEFQINSKTKWLDLRGNHDAFNIGSLSDKTNYFAKYSSRGRDSQRSYMYTLRKPYGQYTFVAVDVVPLPGPKRPYNFFGFLDTGTVLDVQRFARKSRNSNHSFWFGHYPLSIIVSYDFSLQAFLGQHAYSYMCGHLHTLGGSVPNMYSLHPEGFLELELGDWMDNRYYRLVAVDNDMVSFSDLRLSTWPAVHVSWPKDARQLLPHREPAHLASLGREVRVYAFSPDGVDSVKVWIDAEFLGNARPHASVRGLFVLPWQPQRYAGRQLHTVEVLARDTAGRESRRRHEFSLAASPRWQFGLLPSLILLGDVTKFLRLVFYSTWLLLFAPLLLLRVARYRFADTMVQTVGWLHQGTARGLYAFVLSDALFYPWILYFLYLGCGPLMMGYFIDEHFGIMFLSGLYIGGSWLPESFIFVSEFVQLVVFHLPLLLCLSYRLGRPPKPQPGGLLCRLCDAAYLVYALLLLQLFLSVNFLLLTYGLTVFLLSPCRLWQVAFGWYLHRVVCRLEQHRADYCVAADAE